jgi:16S rRNA processing protein RimM
VSAFKPDARTPVVGSAPRKPSGAPSPETLAVAVIVGAHGIRGWVRVHLHDPKSRALRPGLRVTLHGPQGERPSKVLAVDPVPGKPLARVHLDGVTDRDQAEALRGSELWLARKDLPPLAADEFYLADLIGLAVERVRPDGRVQPLGTVIALTSNGAQDLLEVEYQPPGRRSDTWLLPVLPQFLAEIEGRLRVELPIGMLPDALADGDDADDADDTDEPPGDADEPDEADEDGAPEEPAE